MNISGPVSLYLAEYNNVKYAFFGDHHGSLEGKCIPCNDQGLKNHLDNENNCLVITNLLDNIFKGNEKKKKGVDLFLEIPFRKTSKKIKISDGTVLNEIEDYFNDCLSKLQICAFKNVLFHFSDIRFETIDLTSKEYVEKNPKYKPYERKLDTLYKEYLYGINRLGFEEYIRLKLDKLLTFNNEESYDEIKNLLEKIFIGKNSLSYQLYLLYLTSNDIENDVISLFKNIPINKELLIPKNMIVKRRNKTMFRTRAQLEALELEGKQEIAEKIKNFVLDTHNFNLEKLIIPGLNDIFNSLDILKNKNKPENYLSLLNDTIYKIKVQLITNQSLIFDAYTLARMFRSFTYQDDNIKRSKVLIYVGYFHCINYSTFFEKYLHVPVKKYEPKNPYDLFTMKQKYMKNTIPFERCIEISTDDYFWLLD